MVSIFELIYLTSDIYIFIRIVSTDCAITKLQ